MRRIGIMIVGGLLLAAGVSAQQPPEPKFYPDDPLTEDHDRLRVPMPQARQLSQILDFGLSNFVLRPEKDEEIVEAVNVNTLGEVPDSSWFENRIGQHTMSLDELRRGPDGLDDPDLSQLTLTSAKLEGITPGFFARNSRGERFLIKFDPRDYPRLATAAEVISTRFFYAFGYHVPENYLGIINPDDVAIDPAATIEEDGADRAMKRKDLEELIDRIATRDDGLVRVVASRLLPGTPIGPFQYHETRSDDPNDVFLHQNRRELRGLRVFASWLNHDDARSINSLDMYVGDSPAGYVKHHLIDFGSTLGSGSVKPQSHRAGNEYMIEWGPILKAAVTLGIWDRGWRHADYGNFDAVGRLEGDYFKAQLWRPEYPNPAFERMRLDDAFWAATIVARFDEPMIRVLVQEGDLGDPEAEDWVVQALVKRQRKILDYYLARLNPVYRFRVEGDNLLFDNLGEETGVGTVSGYQWSWSMFDNATHQVSPIGQPSSGSERSIPIPRSDAGFLRLSLRTASSDLPEWNNEVLVYLRSDRGWSVGGVERPGTGKRVPE